MPFKTAKYTFSSVDELFSSIDHMLGHKAKFLSIFKIEFCRKDKKFYTNDDQTEQKTEQN